MVAFNFKAQFAHAVESGEKRQTIRQLGRRLVRAGDQLQLYTGMRTKSCRLLREAVCTAVDEIEIKDGLYLHVRINGELLSQAAALELACADGFRTVVGFGVFFHEHYGLPFRGRLIKWK